MTLEMFMTLFGGIVGTIITGTFLFIANSALTYFQTKTGIILSESQKDTIRGAVQTGAGLLEDALVKGIITLDDLHPSNKKVEQIVNQAMDNVKESAKALTVTPLVAANMMIGARAAMQKEIKLA